MSDLFNLKGKTALITGSSRGIGSAIAKELADNGADIIIHCANLSDKAKEVEEYVKSKGRKTMIVCADLSDTNAAQKIYDDISQNFSLPDILVLNASVQIRKKWFEISDEDFDTQMNVNFRSSLKLIQKFAPNMQKNKWGRIVTIGSVQQTKPHEEMCVYSASKDAQMNMVVYFANLFAKDNITVNNIAPGTIYTDRNTKVLEDEAYLKKVVDDIPLKFIGNPEDCAPTALLLCSDAGRFITGENIYVDGGKHI